MNSKIDKTEVYGMDESVIASGYALSTNIDSLWEQLCSNPIKAYGRGHRLGVTPMGTGHDNFLKGIIVQADFTMSGRVWTQALRYNWFDIVSSQSTMHRVLDMDIAAQCSDSVDPLIVKRFTELVAEYKENPTAEAYERVMDSIPNGLQLTARVTTNYRQLKTMFNQRENHRLNFWRNVFIPWCLTLPYFTELTGCYRKVEVPEKKPCNHKRPNGVSAIYYDSAYEMRSSDMHCALCGKHGTREELEGEQV